MMKKPKRWGKNLQLHKRFTGSEIGVWIISLCMVGGIGYLFYDSWIGSVCLIPFAYFIVRWYMQWREGKQEQKKRREFKELLYALSANLRAGYSMENAWIVAGDDLQIIYSEGYLLQPEMERVKNQLHLKISLEQAVQEFARRNPLEEIESFAELLSTAKRSGGNLVHMMDKAIAILTEKMEVEQEIQTMLSGKKLEQRIMCGMPIFMLLYLRMTNPLYLAGLYHNWIGVLVMTACLVATCIAACWGARLIRIEV